MRPEIWQLTNQLLPKPINLRPELIEYYQLLRDYPSRSGKGIRSELLLLSAKAHGVTEDSEEWRKGLWLATALELFQNWVLIHDDIEDDSEQRRGLPALHHLYGMPLALNAGDALHVYMWESVLRSEIPKAMPEFINMIHRTAEGQHLDLTWVKQSKWDLLESDYLQMVELKTAYYTVVYPLRLGAVIAGIEPSESFTEIGCELGAAFQMRDDVLNIIGDTEYGKEIGGDLYEGKRTLIVLHWLKNASLADQQLFYSQMQKTRLEKDATTIDYLLQQIKHSSSIDYVQEIAEQKAKKGLSLLEQTFDTHANELFDLMHRLVQRSH